MGKFAETAIVNYRLSFAGQGKIIVDHPLTFADQGKQTSVLRFRFPVAENKRKLLFSVFGIPETWRH
jgi:hypothetical protein